MGSTNPLAMLKMFCGQNGVVLSSHPFPGTSLHGHQGKLHFHFVWQALCQNHLQLSFLMGHVYCQINVVLANVFLINKGPRQMSRNMKTVKQYKTVATRSCVQHIVSLPEALSKSPEQNGSQHFCLRRASTGQRPCN